MRSRRGPARNSASTGERGRRIVPVVYGLGLGQLTNPLDLYQGYDGADRDAVRQLCERLGHAAGLTLNHTVLAESLDAYLAAVDLHGPRRAVDSEQMELWRGRFEDLVQTGRSSEVHSVREMMYDTLGQPFTPTDPSVHELLSKVLLDQKRFEETVEETDFALSRVDDDPHLFHRKALALTELGDYRTALAILDRIYELYPRMKTNPEVASLEGRIYRERWESSHAPADLDAAVGAYDRAFQANPGDYYPGVNAASLLLAAGEQDQAQAAYERVLERCRTLQERSRVSFWVDFTAAEALVGLGREGEATEEYERGLERTPPPEPRQRESALRGFERLAARLPLDTDATTAIRTVLGP